MKNLDFLTDLVKILIPAAAVMYAMYLVVKSFLNKEFERKMLELKVKGSDAVLPNRLQAYERMALFLERISPNNLLVRVNEPGLSSGQLQQLLLHHIREEFNHNLSQQIYMSDGVWKLIKAATDDTIGIINAAGRVVSQDAKSIELAKVIFEATGQRDQDPIQQALVYLKTEIQQLF